MKTISMSYDIYRSDLATARKQGFDDALGTFSKLLKISEDKRSDFLLDHFDLDAYEIARKLGIKIPLPVEDEPEFKDGVPF